MKNNYLLHLCASEQKMRDAFRLRYLAYRNAGAIHENATGVFKDKYDLLPNANTCIVYEENVPVASVRTCMYSKEHHFLQIPGLEVYSREIEKEIGLDKTIIESNRLVIHPGKVDSKSLFKIPFRFIILNILKFRSDYILAPVRPKHVSIYRRFLGLEPISAPKKYPGIHVDMIMMAGACNALLPAVMEREALFRFTDEEVAHYLFAAGPALMDTGY